MTDSMSSEPEPTRPESVIQAIPLQAVPSQPGPSPAVSPQTVPSQAALFRERRRPADDDDELPLLANADELRAGWQKIKAGFVDNPRGSVTEAANVVEEATTMLVAALRSQQDRIRDSWDGGPSGREDTESMRQALLTYQALFNRIADQ
jgi:hypothetical protein